MKFIDEAIVQISSGKGGDGAVTGRRELYIPRGGPSGGNGGKGGSVRIKGSVHENTLLTYKFNKKFAAANGEAGKSKEQYGKNADDLELTVPLGTLIRDDISGELVVHITQDGERICILEGGQGGIGNMHFSSSTHQYPNFGLLGEPGHSRTFKFELGLLADIALIGTPSVGKSSIINTISAAKAKVADYPFTTLVPHLGSVQRHDTSFNVIDIPGLIEGAAGGKGLGNAFLRHILKSKILCFVIDASRFDSGIEEFGMLFGELLIYLQTQYEESLHFQIQDKDGLFVFSWSHDDHLLGEKILWRVINKSDLVTDEEIRKELEGALQAHIQNICGEYSNFKKEDINLMRISAVTHEGIDILLDTWSTLLTDPAVAHLSSFVISKEIISNQHSEKSDAIRNDTQELLPFLIEEQYLEEGKEAIIRTIDDPDFSRLSFIIPRGNDEAELWYWKVMDKEGWLKRFEQVGIQRGDILHIVSYYEDHKDRFVKF